MIRYCVRCVMPETKPDLFIDESGVCSACRHFEARREVDWAARRGRTHAHPGPYRSEGGSNYDCIIPVSGGKDSTYQVVRMLRAGRQPALRDGDHGQAVRHRPAQPREHQEAGGRLHRGDDEPRRPAPHQPPGADPGGRHLVARARVHLHRARTHRRADEHPPHHLGRELAARVRRAGGGGRATTCSPAAGWRSSADCWGCA